MLNYINEPTECFENKGVFISRVLVLFVGSSRLASKKCKSKPIRAPGVHRENYQTKPNNRGKSRIPLRRCIKEVAAFVQAPSPEWHAGRQDESDPRAIRTPREERTRGSGSPETSIDAMSVRSG